MNSCPEPQILLTEIMMKDQEAGSKHTSFSNTIQRSQRPQNMNMEASGTIPWKGRNEFRCRFHLKQPCNDDVVYKGAACLSHRDVYLYYISGRILYHIYQVGIFFLLMTLNSMKCNLIFTQRVFAFKNPETHLKKNKNQDLRNLTCNSGKITC